MIHCTTRKFLVLTTENGPFSDRLIPKSRANWNVLTHQCYFILRQDDLNQRVQCLTWWGQEFCRQIRKIRRKERRQFTGTANRYTRRAGMTVTIPIWTNRLINCNVWKERAWPEKPDAKPDNAGRSRSKCTRQPPQKKGNEMGEWLVVVVTTAFKMRRRAYLDARLSEHRLMHSECSNILEQKKTSPKFPAWLIWSNLVTFSKFDRYLNIPFSRTSKK